jgi:uncharacterized protein YuzE
MTLSYDKLADVLYITFETLPPNAYVFVENRDGDVLKVDRASNRVVGVTVLAFAARTKKGTRIDIPEIGAVPFNRIAEELLHVG